MSQTPRVLAILALAVLAGCGGSKSATQSSPSPAAPTATASPTIAAAAATAAPSAAPTATGTPDPLAAVKFTDISGNVAEQIIKQEAAAGVFGTKTGAFRPYDPLTRAEFVRWLVRSNNAMAQGNTSSMIRLADPSSDVTFVDVPKSNPDFPYIQGMANAGYVIGVDSKHFAPGRNITREELVAIFVSRMVGSNIKPSTPDQIAGDVGLSDAQDISKPYWGAIESDHWSGLFGSNHVLNRVYGSIKVFHPHKFATRTDAALAVQTFGGSDISRAVPQ